MTFSFSSAAACTNRLIRSAIPCPSRRSMVNGLVERSKTCIMTRYISPAFNYHEIAVIRRANKADWNKAGTYMMIVGGGFAAISVINGGLRQDHPNQWFTTGGYIIAGALLIGGFVVGEVTPKYYRLGGRFKLTYLQITK
jgi:hypothetical protein